MPGRTLGASRESSVQADYEEKSEYATGKGAIPNLKPAARALSPFSQPTPNPPVSSIKGDFFFFHRHVCQLQLCKFIDFALSPAQRCFAHILLNFDCLLSNPKAGEVAEGGRRREPETENSRKICNFWCSRRDGAERSYFCAGTLVSEAMMSDLKAAYLPTAMKGAPIVGRTYTA